MGRRKSERALVTKTYRIHEDQVEALHIEGAKRNSNSNTALREILDKHLKLPKKESK